jgi:hypothetical protein
MGRKGMYTYAKIPDRSATYLINYALLSLGQLMLSKNSEGGLEWRRRVRRRMDGVRVVSRGRPASGDIC